MNSFFKQEFHPPELLGVTEDSEAKRNLLVLSAYTITSVTNSQQQDIAMTSAREIQTYIKGVEEAGLAYRRPLTSFASQIKAVQDDHLKPLREQKERVEKLVLANQIREQKRVYADEQARLTLIGDSARTGEMDAALAIPEAQKAKAVGASLGKKLCYEITDAAALYAARPEFFNLEPKASVIKAVCTPEMRDKPPGIRLWFEDTLSTRRL